VTETTDLAGKKVLIVVTEDWAFLLHRLPIGLALRDAGADVVVAARVRADADRIRATGLRVAPIRLERSGRNPVYDLRTLCDLVKLYRRERPDLVHHVALKPVLYGSIAAWFTGVPAIVNALGGMGFLFIATSPTARILRGAVQVLFRLLMNRRNTRMILQNPDDMNLLSDAAKVHRDRLVLIRGSGVDIDEYKPGTPADGPPIAICASRMLRDKGIVELVEAARLLRSRGVAIRIRLVGPTDDNPASISEEILTRWAAEGAVEVVGPSDDVAGEYARASIAVLPSYREGLPKALLEAAAAGLPMVATDVPGCREICRDGETGLLVPVRTVEPLADALERLATNPDLRSRLGTNARRAVEQDFAEPIIVKQTLDLYRRLLDDTAKR
jgi:glycosyltransferase involved in cell wall biosynthesis